MGVSVRVPIVTAWRRCYGYASLVPPLRIPAGFRTLIAGFTALLGVSAATVLFTGAQVLPASPSSPGTLKDGSVMLPTGFRLLPTGRHLTVGDLPMNLVQSPDSRYLIVANNGLAKPSYSVVDVSSWTVTSTLQVDQAWLGLAFSADGSKVYIGGGNENDVQEFTFANGALQKARTFRLPPASGDTFAGGLAVSPDGRRLYVTRLFAQSVSVIDLPSGQVISTVPLSAEPYTCVVSADGKKLYVSIWGGSKVDVFDTSSMSLFEEWSTGDHPNALVLSPDGKRLFVACGNASAVWVFDTFSGDALEQISMSLYPDAPLTTTPNSVALSPDGTSLLVANADINAVAVVNVGNPSLSTVDGFIPTGWYPTGAIFSRDGKQIYVLSGKGLKPSPSATDSFETRLLGTVSAIAVPDRTTLAQHTRNVYALTPYNDANRLTPAFAPIGSPIPRTVGGSTPIQHVFYIIRENRTYDQILGDNTRGNGDPTLTLFGKDTTTNAHAIADAFVLFDNFYVDADVSYNGHLYSTAAYSPDFVEKIWQTQMASRGGLYLGEGGGFMRNPFGNISAPPQGYLWDFANRASVTVRSYGEFVRNVSSSPSGDASVVEQVPGLKGEVSPTFAGFDMTMKDQRRVDRWLQEFQGYVQNGNLPRLSIIRLGNDHTAGTTPGAPTPRAMMADNDIALGRVVDAISKSVYWKDSAVFVVEDDAQSGPDHVDSHRSVLLVASPFARRNFIDHVFYSTSSVLRTIELILGLPPMSHYDASATPLYNAFQGTPNLAAYGMQMPTVSTDEKNLPTSFGASMSARMDFREADRTPEVLLNEILWHSVKGPNVPMPPPKRSVFVRPRGTMADDDDDRGDR